MKTTLLLLLLLLVGSDSKDQTEAEKEILARQVEFLQPCPGDIHAVLREMAASLAVQKEQIKSLQTENEEHQATLEKQKTETDQLKQQLQEQVATLEKQKTETDQLKQHQRDQVSKLEKQKTETDQLKQHQREQVATLEKQKTETDQLKQHQRDQVSKLEKQKTETDQLKQQLQDQVSKLEKQKTETDQLKQHQRDKQVAFSASLMGDGNNIALGPFKTKIPLVFKRVVTNIGSAYSPHTGIFTAPVRGLYHFEWFIGTHGPPATGAVLFRNSEHIYEAWESQSSGYGSSSNGAALQLEPGDQVYLHLWEHNTIFDNVNHLTTFSGHLVFTM